MATWFISQGLSEKNLCASPAFALHHPLGNHCTFRADDLSNGLAQDIDQRSLSRNQPDLNQSGCTHRLPDFVWNRQLWRRWRPFTPLRFRGIVLWDARFCGWVRFGASAARLIRFLSLCRTCSLLGAPG